MIGRGYMWLYEIESKYILTVHGSFISLLFQLASLGGCKLVIKPKRLLKPLHDHGKM